ncbi:hypothetical protein D3C72_2159280 [compost metagenome]
MEHRDRIALLQRKGGNRLGHGRAPVDIQVVDHLLILVLHMHADAQSPLVRPGGNGNRQRIEDQAEVQRRHRIAGTVEQ